MRQHNDANVIAFGAKFMDTKDVCRRIEIFLTTEFEGGRHEQRIAYIHDIEKKHGAH
jgi:ribose 5-phosphate isomerase B